MAIYTRMRANLTGQEKWTGVWNKKRTQEWDGKWAWEVGSGANRKRGIADTYEDAVSKEAQARRELLTGKVYPRLPSWQRSRQPLTGTWPFTLRSGTRRLKGPRKEYYCPLLRGMVLWPYWI